MARILRGDVLWADLDPTKGREQAGRRPVLVVSHDVFNERSGTVIAMAITSQPKRSWVKVGQIQTLSLARVGKRIGRVSPEEMFQVVEGLNEIVGG